MRREPSLRLLDREPAAAEQALSDWIRARGEPAYRTRQILGHLYERRVADPLAMENLPRRVREGLREELLPPTLDVEAVQVSRDGTRKYRLRLTDGARIESVWIPSGERGTLCVSSQAGCPADCRFCATGHGGFTRNLTPAEIVGQWLAVQQELSVSEDGGVTQLVFMGMGEPLFNYANVRTALRLLTGNESFAFSPRRVTVSTVGVVPRLRELVEDFPQLRLALSLHSARRETRDEIVPLNRRYPLDELRRVLREMTDATRRVSLEYVLLEGVNDTSEEADALADFARATAGHVNVLPFHPFPGAAFRAVSPGATERFLERVRERYRGRVTLRRSRGLDIAGACGQLALLETPAAGSGAQA